MHPSQDLGTQHYLLMKNYTLSEDLLTKIDLVRYM